MSSCQPEASLAFGLACVGGRSDAGGMSQPDQLRELFRRQAALNASGYTTKDQDDSKHI
jgi:hypothetical protein